MTIQYNPRLLAGLKSCSRAASAAAIIVGSLVLVGWVLDITVLKSIFPGLVTMKANTALAFMLAGVSLGLLLNEQANQRRRRIAQACAVIVALIGLLTLSQYLFDWDLGIDQLLFKESFGAVGTFAPGRMAPTTALNFLLTGLAMLLLDTPRGFQAGQVFTLMVGFIGLLNSIGYAYGVTVLYGVASYTQMAVHTAVVFIVLSGGILLARPARGLMVIPTSDNIGGVVARRLLPVAIGVPFLLGWLSVIGQRVGLYGTEFGVALFALSCLLVFAGFVWRNANLLYLIDTKRKWAEEELHRAHDLLGIRVQERTSELARTNQTMQAEITARKRAQEALVDKEEKLQLALAAARMGTWDWDILTNRATCSDSLLPLFSISPGSDYPTYEGFLNIVHPEDRKRVGEVVTKAVQGAGDYDLEFRVIWPDGTAHWIEIKGQVHRDETGRSARMAGVAMNIDDRKRVEEALDQASRLNQQIVANAQEGIIVYDRNLRYTMWSPYMEKWTGLPAEKVLGKRTVELFPELREQGVEALLERALAGEVVHGPIFQFAAPHTGATGWSSPEFGPLRGADGDIVGVLATVRDVTEWKRTEEALRESEDRYRDLVEHSHDLICTHDLEGNILSVNQQAGTVLGCDASELLMKNIRDLLVLEVRDEFDAYLARIRSDGAASGLMQVQTSLGERRVWEYNNTLRTEGVAAPIVRGVARDITERKRAEEALAHALKERESIMDTIPDILYLLDLGGNLVRWNRRVETITGFSPSELRGRPALEFFPEEDRAIIAEAIRTAFEQGYADAEGRLLTKDGTPLPYHWTGVPLVDGHGNVIGLTGVGRDITERKQAEEALRQMNVALAHAMPGISRLDPEGRYVNVNEIYAQMIGYEPDEMIGMDSAPTLHPEDRGIALAAYQRMVSEGKAEFEARAVRKDGSVFHKHVLMVKRINKEGNFIGHHCFMRDISERKRTEALLAGEKRVLEMIATGVPLHEVLAVVTRDIEEQSPGMLCSICLLDPHALNLRHGAAPSLPESYVRAIDGMAIGPSAGSCGTAAYRREPVIVSDIATDPLWADFRDLGLSHGLRACWSTPIFSSQGDILGTFAMYYREPRNPGQPDLELIERATHIAGIAIERKRAEEALREREEQFRSAFEDSATGMALVGVDGRFLKVNRPLCEVLGYSEQELLATTIEALTHPDDLEADVGYMRQTLAGEIRSYRMEKRYLLKLGHVVWVLKSASLVRDTNGSPLYFVAQLQDISARKRGEETRQALYQGSLAIQEPLGLKERLDRLLQTAQTVLDLDRVNILLADPEEQWLQAVASTGTAEPLAAIRVPIGPAGGLLAQAYRTQQMVVWDGQVPLSEPHRLKPPYDRVAAFRSRVFAIAPLVVQGRAIGVLGADRKHSRRPLDPTMPELLQLFAAQAAIAIENSRLFEQIQAGRERLQTLSRQLVAVQEAERHHLARELHDEIGQMLTGVKLTLEMSMRSSPDAIRTTLGETQGQLNDLIARVRTLSLDLRPAMLDDLGLVPALLWHFERYTAQTSVRVDFRQAGLEGRLRPELETAVYRIVQEALTNVARHAGVSEATVTLCAGQGILGVQVQDHGRGFNPATALGANTSSGLAGMSERAELLGGHLKVESAPGAGTSVTAKFPVIGRIDRRKKPR